MALRARRLRDTRPGDGVAATPGSAVDRRTDVTGPTHRAHRRLGERRERGPRYRRLDVHSAGANHPLSPPTGRRVAVPGRRVTGTNRWRRSRDRDGARPDRASRPVRADPAGLRQARPVSRRPTRTVGDQLFERPVILRSRQVRIIRARTAPRRTAAETDATPPRYTASPCTGRDYGCGSSGNKLTSHGFGRSRCTTAQRRPSTQPLPPPRSTHRSSQPQETSPS